ncbi:IclR family transcriptional regulator C-terminal domain-containing protein [Streptomyces sp. SBC-4]|nr:IclR family transcriptional regulator C-terminal domain-containing protein [Streptomyces sp. SBC-4]MDV5143172.1 IclR family transcriptional regulator C-terminal domain-containing protein [Streptomyces sp. SBC-4]
MSRFNEDSGSRPAPEAGAELLTLIDRLAGPPDCWDRPDGDFGSLTHLYDLDVEERERANSLYRLGSKALGRGELPAAADWLGEAASAGHPGALFRLALVVLRASAEWTDDAWFLVGEAARHGHGDAKRLLAAATGCFPSSGAPARPEDPSFFEELRGLLGMPLPRLQPDPHPALPAPGRPAGTAPEVSPVAEPEDAEGRPGGTGLVLVPAPVLPTPYGPTPHPRSATATGQPRLTALAGGLTLPVPGLSAEVPARPHAVPGFFGSRGEPSWSASALRPAVLTDMARHSTTPAVVPARWQTTQRARDMLLLIHRADGIDTRTLARRTRMPMNSAVRLLDWLRGEQFIDTVEGAHFPGPLMALATQADPNHSLVKEALTSLRDELGAAVYLSTYTDGEITVRESAFSTAAPPVEEVAPFSDTGHASANGKSLLAQLDFDSRMDHLTRYPSVQLTGRTITSPRELIEELDGPGPHSAQFDLLEYSDTVLCVAFSLGLPGRASSVALSLPVHEHLRLIHAATILSRRATGLLLVHLLSDDMQQHEGRAWPQADPVPRRALP